jgi:EAL domain-containing protein (putative c-di-GMP-specific phosphodiesterase class I)
MAARIGRIQEPDVLCVTSALARAAFLPADALLFINLAPVSLGHEALGPEALVEAVEAAGLTPERVVIELTERTGARRATLVREAKQLRDAGFRLAVDDAGAGNAGLDTLRCLEPEFIKIDRGVVAASVADRGARAVLSAIVAFAGESGAYVIAEGIEDEATLRHVRAPWPERNRGAISGAQGYHLGRPALAAGDRAKVGT